MDRTDSQVARFAATLAPFDDDTLAALANKGLVRRARKDLEKAPPEVITADEQSVSVSLEGCTIRVSHPPGKSTCTCASGVCRHILAAIIFVRESASAEAPLAPAFPIEAPGDGGAPPVPASAPPAPTSPASILSKELLALDVAALQQWAGKPLLKRAALVLSRGSEVEQTPMILVRLPAQNIVVRLLGATPEAMICSCHAPGPCEHKLAAVLAFQSHMTGKSVAVPQAILQASAGAPRSRDEVRGAVETLMAEMLILGLSRVSTVTEQRLRTLATSAHGVDLPRLERMLKGLADEVRQTLARDAAASSASLLASSARIAALCAALERPTSALVGEHRSVYMPVVGALDLIGFGTRRWRTRSGYQGLTVFFWEPAARRWTSWTDARPIDTPGFDPVHRFEEDGPWPGCGNPRQAAGGKWRLSGAHRNGVGRITSRANTRGIFAGRSSLEEGPLVRDFSNLADVARRAFEPGLTGHPDHGDLVLLAPAAWGEATWDAIAQEVTRPIADANGRVIPLLLRHSPETDRGLTTLQKIDTTTLRAVFGSLRLGPLGLIVEPITLWTETRPMHLTLDDVPSPAPKSAGPPARIETAEEIDDADEEEIIEVSSSSVGKFMGHIEDELLAIAEGGVEVIRDLDPLRAAAKNCRTLGLETCGTAIAALCDELDRMRKSLDRDSTSPARRLLRAAYLAGLASQCVTMAAAISK